MAKFQYEDVDSRLHRFWEAHPDGRVLTQLLHHDEQRVVVRAEIWRDGAQMLPDGSGLAEEVRAGRINETWAVENCETSAVGRALANLGMSPKGARPSATEMGKKDRQASEPPPVPPNPVKAARQALAGELPAGHVDTTALRERLNGLAPSERGQVRAVLEAMQVALPLVETMDADLLREIEAAVDKELGENQ